MIDRRTEMVNIYERVTRIIWERLSPTFGIRTINAIAKNIIVRQSTAYPFVRYLQVNEDGLVWSDLRSRAGEIDEEQLSSGLEVLLDEFFEALSNLIGKLIVGKLFHEAEEMAKKGESTVTSTRARRRVAPLFTTGIAPLDRILGGGIPPYSVVILAGEPGAGKTILSQQILFANATPERKAVYLTTLSESPMKTTRYQSMFSFFDPTKFGESVIYMDVGQLIRKQGLAQAADNIADHVREIQPQVVVIDSFKAIHDLAQSVSEMRTFIYDLAIEFSAMQSTTLLVGEYTRGRYRAHAGVRRGRRDHLAVHAEPGRQAGEISPDPEDARCGSRLRHLQLLRTPERHQHFRPPVGGPTGPHGYSRRSGEDGHPRIGRPAARRHPQGKPVPGLR